MGPAQPEPYFDKTRKIYAIALAGTPFPFLPSDELFAAQKSRQEDEKDDKKDAAKGVTVKVDIEGLQQRVFEVPFPAGAYRAPITDKISSWTSAGDLSGEDQPCRGGNQEQGRLHKNCSGGYQWL